ncbi:ATP-binding cassette sub-family G member 1-like isoform X1 [Macrosteles quadrilineatus]|uniref:ATP-binding cassette sub-family G member 1-like isoform X1 n=3 Tax=Macrosteles quadrilineatus TaxID=74068 RepID=UPI0023E34EEF|nr:ATP-binding cassette sub-family G member 1-like isoform X1 [Macrosteles quadrilineatus]
MLNLFKHFAEITRSGMEAGPPPKILLEFQDLCYTPVGQDSKEILKNVSGRFRPNHVTAILGPSGAGKSTLLKILTGNRSAGVKGRITVNGQPMIRSQFRKLCCYIAQDFAMLGLLTVRETLQVAANFKLPGNISSSKRKALIEEKVAEVLDTLGLSPQAETQVQHLSGGEKKRLSIGVELITNPPVMFFDEPTSGLDSTASLMVMDHLKSLAQRGITVVVVIHQPSSRCFQKVDDVFLLSRGQCLYNGPACNMVETFAALGHECPPYFNIAEFAVEVASKAEEEVNQVVERARLDFTSHDSDFFKYKPLKNGSEDLSSERSPMLICEDKDYKIQIQRSGSSSNQPDYPISSFAQFCILLRRCTLCINRDMHLCGVRLFSHTFVSLLLGILFYNFGNDATKVLGNFSFIFFNVIFIFFATSMPTICTFPLEADVFLREESNNWYPIRVYYFAKVLADVPLQIICPTIFVSVGWYLTGQPLVLYRFGMLWLVSVLIAMLAQTMGNMAGAALSVQTAVFIVPSSTIPVLLLSGFFVTLKDLYRPFQILAEVSYFKFAFEGACQSIFGYDRPKLPCSQPYCHYRHVHKFLSDIGMQDFTFWYNVVCLLVWIVFLQILLYVVLKWRLSKAKT